mgnify:CR=1 FL=1
MHEEYKEILIIITRLLTNLGVPANIKGFDCLRLSILYVYLNDINCNTRITKDVYPYVGKCKNKNSKTIESLIRKTIENTWFNADLIIKKEIFGSIDENTRINPTNKEYIYTIADKLKLNMIN